MPRGKQKTIYPAELVANVRQLYESGLTQEEVGAQLGLSQRIVWRVMHNHGLPTRPATKRDQRGEKNATWKGDQATYAALHYRVNNLRGRADHCSACDSNDPNQNYEWANLTGKYADPYDYVQMCIGCHRRFDARKREAGGSQ